MTASKLPDRDITSANAAPYDDAGSDLSAAYDEALSLEGRGDRPAAARRLDEALAAADAAGSAPAAHRFRALVLRAALAVDLNDAGAARGILAEALQIRLGEDERAGLATDLRRADDLEAFLTHRGCAG